MREKDRLCSARNCFNSVVTTPHLSYFSYPKDAVRCKEWVKRAGRLDLLSKSSLQINRSRYLLCGEHFERKDFVTSAKNKLVHDAVPSIFPPFPTGSTLAPFQKEAQTLYEHLEKSVDDSEQMSSDSSSEDDDSFMDQVLDTEDTTVFPSISETNIAEDILTHHELLQEVKFLGSYVCPVCRKDFKTVLGLHGHLMEFVGEEVYVCPEDDKVFTTAPDLQEHMAVHSGYRCPYCSETFSDHKGLAAHKKTHGWDKPYTCNVCSRSFREKKDHRVHSRLHNDKKLYTCKICLMSLTQFDQIKKHRISRVVDRPYKCRFCCMSFNQPSRLKCHETKNHGPDSLVLFQANTSGSSLTFPIPHADIGPQVSQQVQVS